MSPTDSPNLSLPYIQAAQAQKHVTHNEAVRALDAIVQLSVLDRDLAAPPSAPADGARYIVPANPTGAWAGQAGRVAAFQDAAWAFYQPRDGWVAWVADERLLVAYSGSSWGVAAAASTTTGPAVGLPPGGTAGQVLVKNSATPNDAGWTSNPGAATLGINATASMTNRLAVSSPAVLFNHAGASVQEVLNKNVPADTASILFQTGFAGRAEIGTTGDDDLHIKVTANGTTWFEALIIDRTTGRVRFPSGGARELLTANRFYYVRTDGNDANSGLANTAAGAFATIQRAIDTVAGLDLGVSNATINVADGAYGVVTLRDPVGAGSCFLTGNGTTPANVMIGGTGTCITVGGSTRWSIGGFSLAGTAAISASSGSRLTINGRMRYGVCTGQHIYAARDSILTIAADYEIFGGCLIHWQAEQKGLIVCNNRTITVTGTPAWSYAFAYAGDVSAMYVGVNAFSGAATGTRYVAGANGTINTLNGGANYFPGSIAGAVSSGGQYL